MLYYLFKCRLRSKNPNRLVAVDRPRSEFSQEETSSITHLELEFSQLDLGIGGEDDVVLISRKSRRRDHQVDKSDQLTKSIGWSQYDRDLNTCLTSWFGFVPASSSRPGHCHVPTDPFGRERRRMSHAGKQHNSIRYNLMKGQVRTGKQLAVDSSICESIKLLSISVPAERAPCLKV